MSEAVHITTLSVFPDIFKSLEWGVTGRAIQEQKMILRHEPIRIQESMRIDDRPYGGGPGMVLKPDRLEDRIESLMAQFPKKPRVIVMTPQGLPLSTPQMKQWLHQSPLIVVCGRYEGIDERWMQVYADDLCSIGDYVLSGGEIAACVLIDALARWIPGVLGHAASAACDSFSDTQPYLDHPQYTRPSRWRDRSVPLELTSGHHGALSRWRHQQSIIKTFLNRPDLIKKKPINERDYEILFEYVRSNPWTLFEYFPYIL